MSRVVADLRRRLELAFQRRPSGPSGPAGWLLLGELAEIPALIAGLARREPVAAARMPHTVMLLPGFLAAPAMMRPLKSQLARAGHRVIGWGQGINTGATQPRLAGVVDLIEREHAKDGAGITLVGWSLGGLYAREAARAVPHAVRRVITLGTPFSGDRRANNAWRLYQAVAGHDVDTPPIGDDLALKPPVPTIAIWSARDGIVSPDAARGRPGERDVAVELRCRHIAFVSDRAATAEALRQVDAPL